MTRSLDEVRRLAAADSGLAVAVTVRPDGSPHASVVNAGVLPHPVDGEPAVGFVVAGGAVKLRNLRARLRTTCTAATRQPLCWPPRRPSAVQVVLRRSLRARPYASVVFRAGWEWAAAEGRAELAGPDDDLAGLDRDAVRLLLRDVFTAAGGTHQDSDEYDRVMAAQRRAAVLVRPARVTGSSPRR